MDNEQLWQAILGELELNISKANFTTWFKNTAIINQENNKIEVAVPNAFTKTWMENKYHQYIVQALKKITDNKLSDVLYKVGNIDDLNKKDKKIDNNNVNQLKNVIKTEINNTPTTDEPKDESGLNPKYTFNTFIVGKSNELAYAASKAVAKNPGSAYNPLFIYGGVGLGKTHLLQAVGHKIKKNFPEKKLVYITSEQFTNQFVFAIRSGKIKEFQQKIRNADVLIIDDIQFISGKEQTQEQLFHTFNDLHQNNKQVIFSSDRTPKAIPDLEERLESRFEWGMIVDVSEPDLETKIAIIQSKLEERKFVLDKDVINYLASNINNNIRELEGILNRVIATCQLSKKEPDLDEVKNIIQSVNLHVPKESLTGKKIINTVANFYGIEVNDITGASRKKELVGPRQIIMFLMREEINASFPNIGSQLGGRDHTTAMHAYEKIKKVLKENDKVKSDIILIKQKLYNE